MGNFDGGRGHKKSELIIRGVRWLAGLLTHIHTHTCSQRFGGPKQNLAIYKMFSLFLTAEEIDLRSYKSGHATRATLVAHPWSRASLAVGKVRGLTCWDKVMLSQILL